MRAPEDIERALVGSSSLARALTPNRLCWAGVWLGGASMTCSLLRLSFEAARDEWQLASAILASTLLWSTAAVVAIRSLIKDEALDAPFLESATAARTIVRVALVAGVLGWLNAVSAFLATDLLRNGELGGVSCLGVVCAGPILGGIAGAVFGLVYLWIVWSAERARELGCRDRAETMLLRVGTWLTIAGAVGVVSGGAVSTEIFQSIVLIVGLGCLAAAWAGDASRMAALRRVLTTSVPSLEVRRSVEGSTRATRFIDARWVGEPRELVRWESGGDGPFRELSIPRVIGTIPSTDVSIRRYRLRRRAQTVISLLIAASLGAIFVTMERPERSRRSLPNEIAGNREAIR